METDIESLIREGRWSEARKAITAALRLKPMSHWLIARLGLTYYEQRNYSRAVTLAARALEVAPRCPLALWDYTEALQMLKCSTGMPKQLRFINASSDADHYG